MKQITIAKKLIKGYEGINNTIPYINRGGCGIFAEYLYTYLSKLRLTPKLVVFTNDVKDMEDWIEDVSIPNNADIIHVMVSIEDTLIDSDGIQTLLKKVQYSVYPKTDKLTIDKLQHFNSRAYLWNSVFARNNSTKIESIIRNAYKKVKKDLVM